MDGLITKYPRAFSALWFALAGSIPIAYTYIVLVPPKPIDRVDVLEGMFLPVIVFAVCGAWLGSWILDASAVKSPSSAAMWGLLVSFLAFCISVLLISFINYRRFGDALITLFISGLIFTGWLIMLSGSVAGWLLYKLPKGAA